MGEDTQLIVIAIILGVAFPLLSVVLTEVTLRLQRQRAPLESPVAFVRDLILPALAVQILLQYVVNLPSSSVWIKVVQTVLWLFVIHTALAFINALVFAAAKEGTWQAKMPRLFIDMARGVIVLACVAIVLSTVWDQNLGQLVAALGVGSLVIGFALQEPVGGLFNGIMVMMERPLGLGDWIEVEGKLGTVIESNWRSIHLRTPDNDLLVIPNSVLAKNNFRNFSRPTRMHSEGITIEFSGDHPPNQVKAVLMECATRTTGVLKKPAPKVRLSEFSAAGIEYEIKLPIADFAHIQEILEEYRTLVWYAAKREKLVMPYPTQRHIMVQESSLEPTNPVSAESLRAFPHLGLAGQTELPDAVAAAGKLRNYAKGEAIIREGDILEGLYLVISGRVALETRNASGQVITMMTFERGEFFGEKSLVTGAPSEVTIRALEDVDVLLLGRELVHDLSKTNPLLSRRLADVMAARRKSVLKVREEAAT